LSGFSHDAAKAPGKRIVEDRVLTFALEGAVDRDPARGVGNVPQIVVVGCHALCSRGLRGQADCVHD